MIVCLYCRYLFFIFSWLETATLAISLANELSEDPSCIFSVHNKISTFTILKEKKLRKICKLMKTLSMNFQSPKKNTTITNQNFLLALGLLLSHKVLISTAQKWEGRTHFIDELIFIIILSSTHPLHQTSKSSSFRKILFSYQVSLLQCPYKFS